MSFAAAGDNDGDRIRFDDKKEDDDGAGTAKLSSCTVNCVHAKYKFSPSLKVA